MHMTYELIGLSLLMLFVAAFLWAKWWTRCELRQRRSEVAQYSQWNCPTCDATFGHDIVFVLYGSSKLPSNDRRHVIITCPHCRNQSVCDAHGQSVFDALGEPISEQEFADLLDERKCYLTGQQL